MAPDERRKIMSSFVISKKEYIRVAGFLAGLADSLYCGEPALRLWDYSRNRVYTPDDYYKAFVWLHHLNAKSVQLQYKDDEMETDPDNYLGEFAVYKSKASSMYNYKRQNLPLQVARINLFLNSVLYQIEDQECERQAKGFIYRLMFQLERTVSRRVYKEEELDSWSSFEL